MLYVQRYLVVMQLTPRETAATSAHVLCTPYNVAPVYSVTIRNHIRRMLVYLAVTCQLHFRQNDWDPLRVTAVYFHIHFQCHVLLL